MARVTDKFLSKKIPSDDLTRLDDRNIRIQEKLEHYKENLHENKTSKLWLRYTETVNIIY